MPQLLLAYAELPHEGIGLCVAYAFSCCKWQEALHHAVDLAIEARALAKEASSEGRQFRANRASMGTTRMLPNGIWTACHTRVLSI